MFNIGGGDSKVSNNTNLNTTNQANGNVVNGMGNNVGSNNVTNNFIIGQQGGGDGSKCMKDDPFGSIMSGAAGGFGAGLAMLMNPIACLGKMFG